MSIAHSLSSQQKNNTLSNLEGLGEGNYSKVPNELLEYFATAYDLTSREFRIIFFLLRHLNGWQRREVAITLEEFVEGTKLDRSHIVKTLKSLILKGLIQKNKRHKERTAYYGFTDDHFYRAYPGKTKEESYPQRHLSLVKEANLATPKVADLATLKEANLATLNPYESAPEAQTQSPKDILNISKSLSEEKFEKSDKKIWVWEGVKKEILKENPDAKEKFLDSIYNEFMRSGIDYRGNPIKSVPGFIKHCWKEIKAMKESHLPARKQERKEEVEISTQEMTSLGIGMVMKAVQGEGICEVTMARFK